MQLISLNDVLAAQIGDLKSTELQLVEALPKMADAAYSDDLRDAFNDHLRETRGHVERLKQAQTAVGNVPEVTSKGIAGIIADGELIAHAEGDPNAKDVALIAAAQRVEHYEIAAYGSARELAKELDMSEVERLLGQTLDEESAADQKLNKLATGGFMSTGVNQAAAH